MSVLKIVNSFLKNRNEKQVEESDSLYYSGLLDSLGMFELLLELESKGIVIQNSMEDPFTINLNLLDTVSSIQSRIKK